MSVERWQLPSTWCWSLAGEIADIVGGGTPSSKDDTNFTSDGIPWLTPADLTGYLETYIERGARDLSDKGYKSSSAKLMPAGTVLFSSRAPIGYCVIARNEISTNQGFKSFVLPDELVPEYLRYYLIAAKEYAESIASGTTFKELSGSRAATIPVPVAPTEEQHRIAAKLDSLFARTRQAREELDNIPTLIDHYKQAILAAAFRGELTADWRKENDISDECWTMASVRDVITDIRYGTSKKCGYLPNGIPVLRIPNVTQTGIDTADLKYTELTEAEIEKLALRNGDVLVVRSNGSVDLVGRVAIVDEDLEGFAYAGYLIRLRLDHEQIDPGFLRWMLTAPQTRRTIEVNARSTSGVHNINSQEIQDLDVPITLMEEQAEVVRRIEEAFEWLDAVLDEATSALYLLDHLDQAALAKAFQGELVPQDPDDEPASVLLERIREDRAEQPKSTRWKNAK